MARPPRSKDWTVEVPDDAEWFRAALPQMRSFIRDTVIALDKGLTRAENLSEQVKVLDVRPSDLPVTFDCTLNRPPEDLRIGQARVLTSGGTFTGARDASDWEFIEGGRIRINSITGLSANTQYRLTLFIR
jgi:hypothetical protein